VGTKSGKHKREMAANKERDLGIQSTLDEIFQQG
jgi:hypothetical protein